MDTLYLYWLLYATCSLIWSSYWLGNFIINKKKKKKGTYEKFLLLIRIWPCLKPETFRKFRHNLLHSLDAHECLFTTSPSTILPFHTPPPFLSLKLKSEAWLTRRVEEKLRGNTRVDIDSLGFAIVPSRYHPRNWIPFAVICPRIPRKIDTF